MYILKENPQKTSTFFLKKKNRNMKMFFVTLVGM